MSQLGERVKELRNKKGISQEQLAEDSGLSLRTIQRIEKNENVPRGDTLKKLAIELGTSPDEIIDWKIEKDQNYLTLMSLSTFGFLLFPILGIIIPLTMWVYKKEKIEGVNKLGKSILNFQISWTLLLFLSYAILGITFIALIFMNANTNWKIFVWQSWIPLTSIFYLYNIILIIRNTVKIRKEKSIRFKPSFNILK